MSMRVDLSIIQDWVATNSRVLDLGCGDGTLMATLRDNKNVGGYGLEIGADEITACIAKQVNVWSVVPFIRQKVGNWHAPIEC